MADTVLLAMPVGDGSDDVVEVEVSRSDLRGLEDSGVVLASADGGRFAAAGWTLSDGVGRIMPASRMILGRLRDGVANSDEITMELGLRVGGETGFILAL